MSCGTPPLQPVIFVGHGGGPCFFMDSGGDGMFSEMDKHSQARRNLENVVGNVYSTSGAPAPKAILVISAHFESSTVDTDGVQLVNTDPPGLLYDYHGFPPQTYALKYPCPHAPWLVDRCRELLGEAGIESTDAEAGRGLDHGVFIPLKLIFPRADIPVVQISLRPSLDASKHIELGAALASLRSEGVLIVGSGMLTHNLRLMRRSGINGPVEPWAGAFQEWIDQTITKEGGASEAERLNRLVGWEKLAPEARVAHPREEHLLPLLVAAGAANMTPASKLHQGWAVGQMSLASYVWN